MATAGNSSSGHFAMEAIAKATGMPQVEAHFGPLMKETSAKITELQKELETAVTSEKGKALMAEVGQKRKVYIDLLMQVSDRLGAWIVEAQGDGDIDSTLPPEVVLYTVFARACDPVPGFLKAGGQYSDGQIVEWVLRSCMNGLAARP